MRKLRSILFATDLRSASHEIADVAIRLALAADARVTLLHVLEPISRLSPTPSAILSGVCGVLQIEPTVGFSEATGGLKRVSEKALQDVAARFTSQHVSLGESTLVVGPVADTIVQKANEMDADLIVIGAGDRARFDRFSVGPVAVSVIEHAAQPVLAIRPDHPKLTFQKILCPVDHSATSARGLRNAILLARVFGGELVVLSVIPEISWWTAAFETGQLNDSLAAYSSEWRAEFEQFLTGIDFKNVPVTKDVRFGAPHHQIAAAAKDHQADLIVMGATGRSGLVRVLLGSTTRRMLEELPCSLLTVKQDNVLEELFESDVRDIGLLLAEAWTFSDLGLFVPAIAKYRQVLTRHPFHIAALEGLVSANEKIGETVEADRYRRRLASSLCLANPRLDSPEVSF